MFILLYSEGNRDCDLIKKHIRTLVLKREINSKIGLQIGVMRIFLNLVLCPSVCHHMLQVRVREN